MTKIKLELKKQPKASTVKECWIIMRCAAGRNPITNKYEKFVKSTGHRIHPKDWSTKTERPKESFTTLERVRNKKGELTLSDRLDIMHKELETIIKDLKSKHLQVSKFNIEQAYISIAKANELKVKQQAEENKKNQTVLMFLDKITASPASYFKKNRSPEPSTLKIFTSLSKHLAGYLLKKGKNETLNFQDIQGDFFPLFETYLRTKEKPLNDASIAKYMRTLKWTMNLAALKGYHSETGYKSYEIKVKESENPVWLNPDNLDAIYSLDLSKCKLSKAKQRVYEIERDRLILGCQIGLRFGDSLRIDKKFLVHNDSGWSLKMHTQKTGEFVELPVSDTAIEVLKKYNYSAPPPTTNQQANKHIKEICRLAGIKDEIITVNYRGGKRIETSREKWELITTHTFRRSAVTNLYLETGEAFLIMRVFGWKSEDEFKKYIKLNRSQAAEQLRKKSVNAKTALKAVG